jgi:hypothetical protein
MDSEDLRKIPPWRDSPKAEWGTIEVSTVTRSIKMKFLRIPLNS